MTQFAEKTARGTCQPIQIKPVGIVRNESRGLSWDEDTGTRGWRKRVARMKKNSNVVSELAIDTLLDGILDGIDEFSHLLVVYWAHLVPPEKRSLTRVHPLGSDDLPLTGIFATHSPARPNPILVTIVKLLERKGNILKVTGLDALDGSPILDIKPYHPTHENAENVKTPGWVRQIQQQLNNDVSSSVARREER